MAINPDTSGLHPLVLHGPLVWKAALLLLILAGAIVGCSNARRLRRHRVSAALLGMGLGVLAFSVLFVAGGALALRRGASRILNGTDDGNALSLTVAATSTPFHRDTALRQLLRSLDLRIRPNAERRDRSATLMRLLGEERAAAKYLLAHGAPEAAAPLAERLGDMATAGVAYFQAGRFEQASGAFLQAGIEPNATVVQAHLIARRYRDAAREAAIWAEELRAGHDFRAEAMGRGMQCIAHALQARAGEPGAIEKLRALAANRAMCIVLLADLLDASERRRLLLNEDGELRDEVAFDTHEMAFARHHVRSIAAMLTMEGEEPCIQYRRGGASHDVTRAAILRCEKTSPVERVYLLTDAGDDDGARRLLQASSGLASISSWEQSYSSAAAFLRDIEVAAAPGDAQECNRAIEAGARGGPHQNFFRLIQKGDSEGVVRLVRENDSYLPDSFLVSCGGRLGPIGDALRGWNDAAAYHPCPYCGFDPALSALRRRRWNAYRLRASSQAEKLSKIVRRFVPVVLDREIAVPFEMIGAYGKDAETWAWERRPASGEP